jgi:acetate kinase
MLLDHFALVATGIRLFRVGVKLDESRNRAASNPVRDGAARCQALVLASQENKQIARHAWALLA